MRGYADADIIGRPSTATAARGKATLDSLTATFAGHLKALTG
jgi:creatinine amidohydrolase